MELKHFIHSIRKRKHGKYLLKQCLREVFKKGKSNTWKKKKKNTHTYDANPVFSALMGYEGTDQESAFGVWSVFFFFFFSFIYSCE